MSEPEGLKGARQASGRHSMSEPEGRVSQRRRDEEGGPPG
jgi:hypothetical protein